MRNELLNEHLFDSLRQGRSLCAAGHGRAGGLRAGGPPADRLSRRLEGMDGDRMFDRNAAPRRYRGMVSAGRNRDDLTLGQDLARFARSVDRVAPCIRTDGRGSDELEPCRSSAQPRLDGSARSHPRSDRAGAVSNVASDIMNDTSAAGLER